MATIAIKILEILEQQLEPVKAKSVAKAIEQAIEENNKELREFLATKEDLAKFQAATKEEIANLKAELIKWMFIFWIGQFASIVGVLTAILFAFFRK